MLTGIMDNANFSNEVEGKRMRQSSFIGANFSDANQCDQELICLRT